MLAQFFKNNKDSLYVLTGTFLEFFDLYMYVHLAHIIHKFYFVDAHAHLLNAFTFANIYLFAPIGCVIFAYLGDTIGRKKIIISTSILMAFCSSSIGFLPTYDDIGALAGIILITLRILQGISLSGEPIAAFVYLAESTPYRYGPFMISVLTATKQLGGAVALGIGYLAIHFCGERAGWRIPFYLGTVFCFFSLWLRWYLAESKEYLHYTSQHKGLLESKKKLNFVHFYRSLSFKQMNVLSLFGIGCAAGVAFMISYVYLGKFLMQRLDLTEHELLLHNFQVALCDAVLMLIFGAIVVIFNLNVKKFVVLRTLIFLCILPFFISVLKTSPSVSAVFIVQVIISSFMDKAIVAVSLIKVFSVIGRFSLVGMSVSCAKFFCFFMSGVVLSYISSLNDVAWLLGVMFPMALIFLLSVMFYVPYETLVAETPTEKINLQKKEAA